MPEEPKPGDEAGKRSEQVHQEQAPPPKADQQQPAQAPAPNTAEATAALPAEEGRPGRARRVVRHPVTHLVAAGLVGILIGGGAVALLDDAYRGDREPARAAFEDERRPGEGFRMHPRFTDEGKGWHGGPLRRIPEHHHGENGEVIPGPAERN